MNDTFLDALRGGSVLLADGATGTNLQAAGLPVGTAPEEWVLDRPDAVIALHRAFVEAGSDILLTCTFGGTRIRLDGRAELVNQRAAELAREAASEGRRRVFVGGSLGPTGQLMEPLGTLRRVDVVSAFAEQAAALAAAGVDFLLFETFFALEEAQAAIEGAASCTELPIVCTFSYDRGMRTMMGVGPGQMGAILSTPGVAMIGANCGTTLHAMESVIGELGRLYGGARLWAKPNAGLPTGSPPQYTITPAQFAAATMRLVDAGARVVGGCCGTTPAHVRAMAKALGRRVPQTS
jgi:5-methyltetrahydrofolate--homocysteine methyltransferase